MSSGGAHEALKLDLDELTKLLSKFNPFEVLKMERMEIRHSNVLAWLLDSEGSHGLGVEFAEAWFACIAEDFPRCVNAVADVMKNAKAATKLICHREWRGKAGSAEAIDILIEIFRGSQLIGVVCVENKIQAPLDVKQLQEYEKIVNSAYQSIPAKGYIFLSRENIVGKVVAETEFLPMSHASVAKCLASILRADNSRPISPDVRDFLHHYYTILRRHVMKDSPETKQALEIYRKHRKALDYIFSVRPDERSELSRLIAEKLAEAKNELGIIPLLVDEKQGMIRFIPKSWETQSNQADHPPDWREVLCQIGVYRASVRPVIVATTKDDKAEDTHSLANALRIAAKINRAINSNAAIRGWYEFYEVRGHSIDIDNLPDKELELLADSIVSWAKKEIQSDSFLKMTEVVARVLKRAS